MRNKRNILLIILSLLITNIYSQNCDYVSIFDTQIEKNNFNINVTFLINNSNMEREQQGYCLKIYQWDFGDGSSPDSVIVYPDNNNYFSCDHSYSLSNPDLINNGFFEANVTLTVTYYADFSTTPCQESTCYSDIEYIFYDLGTPALGINCRPEPHYYNYLVGQNIQFIYNISSAFLENTDNIRYILTKSGSQVDEGPVTTFNQDVTISPYNFTPQATGSYPFVFKLTRYGVDIGSPVNIDISVTRTGGGGGTPGSCECSDLMPDLNVTYTISGNYIYFVLADNSSAEFKSTYGGCAEYSICVVEPEFGCFNGTINHGTIYPIGGFVTVTDYIKSLPGVLDPPDVYEFRFQVSCKEGENTYRNTVYSTKIFQPKEFNPEIENNIMKPYEASHVSIPTHTDACSGVEAYNPNNLADGLSWVSNLSTGYAISFDITENTTDHPRELEIKYYPANGNYDKILTTENGVLQNYRKINVYQHSKYIDDYSMEVDGVPFDDFNYPSNTAFFVVSSTESPNDYFYRNKPRFIPYEYYYNLIVTDKNAEMTIRFYDSNGQYLNFVTYDIGMDYCDDGVVYTAPVLPQVYLSFNNGPVTVPAYTVENNKFLILTSASQISGHSAFKVVKGGYFLAKIVKCDNFVTKSAVVAGEDAELLQNGNSKENFLQDDNKFNLKIYPNPNKGVFKMEFSNYGEVKEVKVYNLMGTLIHIVNPVTSDIISVNLFAYPQGMYIIRTETVDRVYLDKVVIE